MALIAIALVVVSVIGLVLASSDKALKKRKGGKLLKVVSWTGLLVGAGLLSLGMYLILQLKV